MHCLTRTIFFSASVLPMVSASAPKYTIEARLLPDYTFLVPVRVNGAGPFWCAFDSGGGHVLSLDSAIAEKAGFRPTGTGNSAGVGPEVVADKRLPGATLQIGQLSIPNRTVVIRPMGQYVPYDCIFGTATLDSFAVEIDYVAPAVRLYDAQTFKPGQRAVSIPMTFDNHGGPIVPARLILQPGEEVYAKFLVDTGGGQWALAISKRFTDDNRILNRVRKTVEPPFQAGGTGGSVALLAARADRLSVGPFGVPDTVVMLFRTESAVTLPYDGNLTNEFFRRFLLTIDYPNERLFLEPNRDFGKPPQSYDGSGAWIRGTPGNFVIQKVLAASPAAAAGLQKGDVLLSLDEIPASDLTIYAIKEKLYRPRGRITLQVQRGGTQLSAVLELTPFL
jgi:PDZ domain/Aspartyl protease